MLAVLQIAGIAMSAFVLIEMQVQDQMGLPYKGCVEWPQQPDYGMPTP